MKASNIILATFCAAALLAGCKRNESEPVAALPPVGPDELAFSIDNMDPSVDPADDYRMYATGGWQKRVERPADMAQMAFMNMLMKRIDKQLEGVVENAAAESGDADKGATIQQIGTLYNAYMDMEAVEAKGVEPIRQELDRLSAVSTPEELSEYLGHYALITGQWPLMEVEVYEGISDASRNEAYIQPAIPGLEVNAVLEGPADAPAKQLYVDYIAGMLTAAGYEEDVAKEIGRKSVAIESMLHEGKMASELRIDYRNWDNPRTISELQAAMPSFPLAPFLAELGLDKLDRVILTDVDTAPAIEQVMNDFTIDEIKDYLAFRLVQRFAGLLPVKFEAPGKALNKAFMGVDAPTPPRGETAMQLLKAALPQPLGKLYTDNFFEKETQAKGMDMIKRMQAAFRKRVEKNDWMAESTKAEALQKIDGFYYRFGLPDRWIDYSSIEIGDDLVQNSMNASRFWTQRKMNEAGKPVEHYAFASPEHTAPTTVNAAYNPSINGFEVTAAIAQPPGFEPDMDAPIYFCRLGAVIGHEMTHGFDSGGRLFDHTGSMNNWWTDKDAAHFESEAQKLVEQGNQYESKPGLTMNGQITVKENMADVGGIAIAYDALMDYLEENPDENVEIDGFSPTQRCFLAWSQLWAEKSSEQALPILLQDNHAPGNYRTYAPLQHLPQFYEAFDIKEGDPMWLPPEKRLNVW